MPQNFIYASLNNMDDQNLAADLSKVSELGKVRLVNANTF